MIRKIAGGQISVTASAIAILTAGLIVTTVEIHALRSREPKLVRGATVNSAECVRCHSDPVSISRMRDKEGGANYLFNSDGTFKDPKLASLNGNFRHPMQGKVAPGSK